MVASVDAIVLAGDRGAARAVGGVANKSLLPVGGHSLLERVLLALLQVEAVGRIVVVGPEHLLRPVVAGIEPPGRIELLEQADTAYANFWRAFTHLEQSSDGERIDRQVLVTGADMPLVSAGELREFLHNCARRDLDYCVGMSAEAALRRFYPTASLPGIHMRYLHLAEASLRLNNLHLVRPRRVQNRDYIDEVYGFRYQRDIGNMLRTARDLLGQEGVGWRALRLYLMLQLAELGHQRGWPRWWDYFRSKVTRRDVEAIASSVLQTRAGIVETTQGGCAIDVDNEQDYAVLQLRWEEFRRGEESGP
ncbi:NTP transferase domain-containing protein [Parahaliea aestuarii]|uniref:NTP transferase domain-containing protein n=1 Tax=Parahaliea aestuarii TaxID=1852021 RepID=A0A5C8ZXV7_9GAMM|nr:NTP transferase domain-containing protein [Parahaliea aestuarii]TXS93423.1 NTP transferase domain-containing protein [Parahaliea aestuarii]